MKKNKLLVQVVILIAIVIVVNLIADKLFFRLDFTADGRYTLSNATKNVLKDLDDVVTVKAIFRKICLPTIE